ncbi:MAG: hypothetical protein LBG88_02325 [Christensenellaceae bacterium]|jgi:hypothetical protein|nr:hypothetical protein [Christensenellaceae bacterium]
METEKIYLQEKENPMPAKKIKQGEPWYLTEEELQKFMRQVEVIKPWEFVEVNKDAVGVPAFVISKVDTKKLPKDATDRTGTFFNVIQYKFSCDIKNGKLGKNSLANFTTYVKGGYSYSYAAYVLEKLRGIDKAAAKEYATQFKAELQKLYDKKIADDTKAMEKYKAEIAGTVAESKVALAKIKI